MKRRRSTILLVAAMAALLLTLSCGLTYTAVRQGALTPPPVSIELGVFRVVGGVSKLPQCSQLINPGCVDVNPVPATLIYTLWLFVKSDRNSWDRPDVTRLFQVQLGH